MQHVCKSTSVNLQCGWDASNKASPCQHQILEGKLPGTEVIGVIKSRIDLIRVSAKNFFKSHLLNEYLIGQLYNNVSG